MLSALQGLYRFYLSTSLSTIFSFLCLPIHLRGSMARLDDRIRRRRPEMFYQQTVETLRSVARIREAMLPAEIYLSVVD